MGFTMKFKCSILLFVILILGRFHFAFADEENAKDLSWEEAAREAGLSEEDIALLGKNRILVSNESFKQIFEMKGFGLCRFIEKF